jgi:hypothetical protein
MSKEERAINQSIACRECAAVWKSGNIEVEKICRRLGVSLNVVKNIVHGK